MQFMFHESNSHWLAIYLRRDVLCSACHVHRIICLHRYAPGNSVRLIINISAPIPIDANTSPPAASSSPTRAAVKYFVFLLTPPVQLHSIIKRGKTSKWKFMNSGVRRGKPSGAPPVLSIMSRLNSRHYGSFCGKPYSWIFPAPPPSAGNRLHRVTQKDFGPAGFLRDILGVDVGRRVRSAKTGSAPNGFSPEGSTTSFREYFRFEHCPR